MQLIWIMNPNGEEAIIIDTRNLDDAEALERYALPGPKGATWEIERIPIRDAGHDNANMTKWPTDRLLVAEP